MSTDKYSMLLTNLLSQTWEDPAHVDTNTKAKGDNDPLDAVEVNIMVSRD